MSILHEQTVTWRRTRGGWTAVAPANLHTRLDEEGLDSPGGLLRLVTDRGFTTLVDDTDTQRIQIRRGTSTRAVVTTSTGRYRVAKQLMRPIWDVTPEVAGEPIIQVLAAGPVLRLRPASGAEALPSKELADLHRGVIVGILSCRRALPGPARLAAAA